jgi:hypothetical protein
VEIGYQEGLRKKAFQHSRYLFKASILKVFPRNSLKTSAFSELSQEGIPRFPTLRYPFSLSSRGNGSECPDLYCPIVIPSATLNFLMKFAESIYPCSLMISMIGVFVVLNCFFILEKRMAVRYILNKSFPIKSTIAILSKLEALGFSWACP